jgi:rod shape-determining protein MreC
MTERRFHAVSLLGIALGLVLFFSDVSRLSFVRETVKVINTLTSPVLNLKEKVIRTTERTVETYFQLKDVRSENIKLREKIESLLLIEKELEVCTKELNTLQQKVGIHPVPPRIKYSLTRIVFFDPSGLDQFVIIEGGKNRGFREGDVVVSEDYVVGIVESVHGSTSRVITPFNENFSTSAYVRGKFKKYIFTGGFPRGNLLHVNVEDPVKEGEEVFFLDPKRRIPPFLIGKIMEVRRGKDPFFKEVKIQPAADPRRLEYVFVIRRGG